MKASSSAPERYPDDPHIPVPSANGDVLHPVPPPVRPRGAPLWSDPAVELSSRRTGMSFQRTRLSADRTLMGVIRTSLALITFGFTIFQIFRSLYEQNVLTRPVAARNFGLSLVAHGIGMLVVGIVYHVAFMLGLRSERAEMAGAGLIYGASRYPPSFTLITAFVLLMIGVAAIVSMLFQLSRFG